MVSHFIVKKACETVLVKSHKSMNISSSSFQHVSMAVLYRRMCIGSWLPWNYGNGNEGQWNVCLKALLSGKM
jgi:hypothetical protein